MSDRIQIEAGLNQNDSARTIALDLGKDATTVSKEVKKRRIEKEPNYYNRSKAYVDALPLCPRQTRFPYVCNACPGKAGCRKLKHSYRAQDAHAAYRYDLSDSRQGYDLTVEALKEMDDLMKPLIVEQRQSLYHIAQNNSLPKSLTTLYTYVEHGLFSFRNIDLTRKVRYKQRKKRNPDARIKPGKTGHLYADYLRYIQDNDCTQTVQIDTVEGTNEDRKCLLTIFFLPERLMLVRLLPKQQANYVKCVFDGFEKKLGLKNFQRLFEACLTDNGSEFSDLSGMEFSPSTGEQRMHLFYCDPQRSDQKGALEKNHEFIRCILPKGTSFAFLTHQKVKRIETHINSYARKSLHHKTPYELFEFSYGASVCRLFQLGKVNPNDVILKPLFVR